MLEVGAQGDVKPAASVAAIDATDDDAELAAGEWEVIPSRMIDPSKFTPQQLMEFEILFERVFGVENKRIPFANSVKVRTICPGGQEPAKEKEAEEKKKDRSG